MHSFVVLVSMPGRRIPEHVLERVRRADMPELFFVPEDRFFWSDDAGGVVVAGWQAYTDVVSIRSHWHTSERGITAFSGRLWPKGGMWRTGEAWAQQLERYWVTHPVADSSQQLDGVYAALSIQKSGVGTIVTDPLSIALLYHAETDDFVAISSNASLAAGAERARPTRDALAVAWLPFFGHIVGDRTGFLGTRVLAPGSYVQIHPAHGCRVSFTSATPWTSPFDASATDDELIDRVHEDLTNSVRSIAQLPAGERLADITGGRDSRLVLSLMLQEGIADKFVFHTRGDEHTPDAVVGRAIGERFRLRHAAIVPTPMQPIEFRRRLTTHVFQTSGMLNPWDFKGGLSVARRPKVSGLFGELLSTNYRGYPTLSSVGELRDEFHRRAQLDCLEILHPAVRSELGTVLDSELLERIDTGGSTPQDRLDSFYVRQRLRRWFGTTEEMGEGGRVFPLYSLAGLQSAFALGAAKRRREFLAFSIMRKACPALAQMPFANQAWSEELYAHLPDADEYRARPVRNTDRRAVQWQIARVADNPEVVEDLLLDEPTSRLYEIIDRKAVERLLRGAAPQGPAPYREIFGALACAIWLGEQETRVRFGAPAEARDDEPRVPVRARGPRTGLFRRLQRRTSRSRG